MDIHYNLINGLRTNLNNSKSTFCNTTHITKKSQKLTQKASLP